MEKISAVIITLNAQSHLDKCLDSIKSLVDETIIVDSGSIDKTLDIAKKHDARIFRQDWLGFAGQKNFGIAKAKNKWVLSLDADEIINPELEKNIKKADLNTYDGFYLSRRNYFGKKWIAHCGWYPDYQLRLFRADKMNFEKKEVHEIIKSVGKIGILPGDLIHYTYKDDKEYFKKFANYTTLDAKFLFSKKKKWSVVYQIGKPIKEFWQMYIEKKGILDGFTGLKVCLFSAYYRFIVAAKLKELNAHRN